MSDILYNKEGDPMMVRGATYLAVSSSNVSKRTNSKEKSEDIKDTFKIGEQEFVSWGASNAKPDELNKIIKETGVLKTGLSYK